MEEQKLCKTCIEWLKNKYGVSFYITPFSHCHHPEPRCWWCEDWKKFEIGYINMGAYETTKKLIGLNPDDPECPICGKKLWKEN